jgi:hypothetical protein
MKKVSYKDVRIWVRKSRGCSRSCGLSLHSSKRVLSDGENQPDETLLISFGAAWWQICCYRGREKHIVRETEIQIGNPGSNQPPMLDNDRSSHEGDLL